MRIVAAAALATGCGARTDLAVIVVQGDVEGGAAGDLDSGAADVDASSSDRAEGGAVASAKAVWVSAGVDHACAVTREGAAMCWGYNAQGQLGNGSTTESSVPVPVKGLSSGVVAISAGSGHTCAVTQVGGVQCWGLNNFGQLGDGSNTDSHVPVDVAGVSNVVLVSTGNGYTCAVTAAGAVECWGILVRPGGYAPVDIPGLTSGTAAVSVGNAAGAEQACAVDSAGVVSCWGSNYDGALGDGTTAVSEVETPVLVSGTASSVVGISAGDGYTCAVTGVGGVLCWGADVGIYPRPLYGGSDVPVPVTGFSSPAAAVSAGSDGHACVVTAAAGVECWGTPQYGDDTVGDRSPPAGIPGLSSGVLAVSAADGYSCALTASGAVECWGTNLNGQLGNGSMSPSAVPVEVTGF